eukprot:6069-Rhodomonas_salina.3
MHPLSCRGCMQRVKAGGISLRVCYAVSGTDLAWYTSLCGAVLVLLPLVSVAPSSAYAVSGTDSAYGATRGS